MNVLRMTMDSRRVHKVNEDKTDEDVHVDDEMNPQVIDSIDERRDQ